MSKELLAGVHNAIRWIERNSILNQGIRTTSNAKRAYPEVTGYLVPTLIEWGERDIARNYVDWLLSIQLSNGGFADPTGRHEMVFDTGQVMRGLLAANKIWPSAKIEDSCRRCASWVMSLIDEDGGIGRIPDSTQWKGAIPLQVLLYSFEPFRRYFQEIQDIEMSRKIDNAIGGLMIEAGEESESSLNHFHAYYIDAVLDLGYVELARKLMFKVKKFMRSDGFLPGRPSAPWMCSTGQFQYAQIFYKLGQKSDGDAALFAGLGKQNRSGGWFGSYRDGVGSVWHRYVLPHGKWIGQEIPYFSNVEIPWATKYFLDAVDSKLKLEFEEMHEIFSSSIDLDDGRLLLLRQSMEYAHPVNILDVGCGKGRYLRALGENGRQLVGVDLSASILKYVPDFVEARVGSLTNLPCSDGEFDFVFAIESLEHAVNVKGAIRELSRVVRVGGTLLIIDKNSSYLGRFRFRKPLWEQWFNRKHLSKDLRKEGFSVEVVRTVPYEGRNDGLFAAWICVKMAS